jgi:hypothetical protein
MPLANLCLRKSRKTIATNEYNETAMRRYVSSLWHQQSTSVHHSRAAGISVYWGFRFLHAVRHSSFLVLSGVQLFPRFYPRQHTIRQLIEVGIQMGKSFSNMFRQLDHALENIVGFGGELDFLEERDNFLLPEDTFILLSKVHERIGCFGMPNVWQSSLDSQPQVVGNDLEMHASVARLSQNNGCSHRYNARQ